MSQSKSSADTSSTLALEDDPRPDGLRSAKSLVLVLTGNGKGKSSSAFGMVMRAVAREWKVCVVQFIKSSEWQVGEQKICESLNVQWHSLGGGFTWDSNNIEHDKDLARKAWEVSTRLIQSGEFDLIVLDEVSYLQNSSHHSLAMYMLVPEAEKLPNRLWDPQSGNKKASLP